MSAFHRLGGSLSSGTGSERRTRTRARGRSGANAARTELIGTFWRWPAALFLVATLISLATVLAIAIGNRDANVAPLIWPALFGWITFRYYRSRRLEFDDTVVIVRNFWRTRTFDWVGR